MPFSYCVNPETEPNHWFYSRSLALTIKYLTDFQLDHVFKLTKYFTHFSSKSHMTLNANTMANLEIYRNSTNYTEKHSLFWILNHTCTAFGKRLLKRWVGRPLVDRKYVQIEEQ
jgi:DNA mismatch repair protein MSH3